MIPPAPPDRRPGSYDVKAASEEAAYVETMPSLTVQSMSEDADLNVMMKRFGLGAPMPTDARQPAYGDFTVLTDYRSAIEAARLAEESFLSFPAEIRSQFDNDPQLFLEFVENPANIATVRQWFPKQENLNAGSSAGGSSTPQSGTAGEASGAGAPPGDGGAKLPK